MRKIEFSTINVSRLVLVICMLLFACQHGQHVVAEVLHWEVTERVAEVSDPDAIFGNVLVDDPVQGYFCYDTSLEPELFFGLAFYMGENWPTCPVLVVENPRDQSELAIGLPANGGGPSGRVADALWRRLGRGSRR